MTTDQKIHDSPSGWVRKHVQQYVETDGRRGHKWSGVRTLLLTVRGRKSGKLRRTALIYGEENGRYIIVASKGGHKHHPAWYLNLCADPHVYVQVGAEKFAATAYTAEDEERERLWQLMAEIWPDYDNYQKRTRRQIPVVVLVPEP